MTNSKHTGRHLTLPVPSLFGHIHPLGHGVHRSWAPHEYVPSSQSNTVDVLVNGQYFPSGQTMQDCLLPSEYVPEEKGKNNNSNVSSDMIWIHEHLSWE